MVASILFRYIMADKIGYCCHDKLQGDFVSMETVVLCGTILNI